MHVGIEWVWVAGGEGREREGGREEAGGGEVVPQILELWLQLVGLARPQVAIVSSQTHLRD